MSAERVISIAKNQIGVKENPQNSNNVIYNSEYYGHDVNGSWYAWCVTFLWWVFKKAGESKAFFNGGKTNSCTTLMNLYKAENLWFTSNYIPGDIAILTFNKNREPQHCGLIIDWADDEHTSIITIEGNTTAGTIGNEDNGGIVAIKIRYLHQILGVCRPRYSPDPPKKDWEDHWAANYISEEIKKGIMSEYPDGNNKGKFMPDQNLTRAEAAAMNEKLLNYIQKNYGLENVQP